MNDKSVQPVSVAAARLRSKPIDVSGAAGGQPTSAPLPSPLEDFMQTVSRGIAANRIGRPVSARLHLTAEKDAALAPAVVAAGIELSRRWFSSALVAIDPQWDEGIGELAVLAEFANGCTALVCSHPLRGSEPIVDGFLLGDRGAIYFDGFENARNLSPLAPMNDWLEAPIATIIRERKNKEKE